MSRLILSIALFLVFLTLVPANNLSVHAQNAEVKIIFRNSLNQYYSTDLYKTLIGDLESTGVVVSSYNGSDVLPDLSNLSQYDILVIPNPGSSFSSQELDLIKSYLDAGGNLIIMGDIQYDDRHYGKPDYLNALLDYIGVSSKVKFWGTNDNGDELKDNTNLLGNRNWQISVTSKYFSAHIISVGIEKVAVNSPSLIVSDPSIIIATTPETAYAEDTEGNIHASGRLPWLVAMETSGGKVVVCGGSRIFSDARLYGPDIPYVTYGDNERLFFNIVWWITGVKIEPPVRVSVFVPILDIFGIIAGIIGAHFYRLKSRSIAIFAVLGGIIFGLIGMVEVLVLGETVIGISWQGWGYVSTGIGEETTGIYIEAWQVAAMRYFLGGIILVLLGVAIYWLIIKLDEYLKLGIREKLGIA